MNSPPEKISKAVKEAVRQLMTDDLPEEILVDFIRGSLVPTSKQIVEFGKGGIAQVCFSYNFIPSVIDEPPAPPIIKERTVILTCSNTTLAVVAVKPSVCYLEEWRSEGTWVSIEVILTPRSPSDQEWMRELMWSMLLEPSTVLYTDNEPAQNICLVIHVTRWHSGVFPPGEFTIQEYTYTLFPANMGGQHGESTALMVDTTNMSRDQWVQGQFQDGCTFHFKIIGPLNYWCTSSD